jgi:DNA-binding transcriptional MerR regulator
LEDRLIFRIGEFSKIAQVSARLLRYYEQIGLFHAIYTDPNTGNRYYSAEHLPQLNRILALKDLRLGWQTEGEPELYHGQPHQLMRASLAMAQSSEEAKAMYA